MTIPPSIQLRERITGECDCGTPHNPCEHYPDHRHDVVCDWGVIEHPNPQPDRGEVGPLMLAAVRYVRSLILEGPVIASWGALYSAATDGERTFMHIGYGGRRSPPTEWNGPAECSSGGGPTDGPPIRHPLPGLRTPPMAAHPPLPRPTPRAGTCTPTQMPMPRDRSRVHQSGGSMTETCSPPALSTNNTGVICGRIRGEKDPRASCELTGGVTAREGAI